MNTSTEPYEVILECGKPLLHSEGYLCLGMHIFNPELTVVGLFAEKGTRIYFMIRLYGLGFFAQHSQLCKLYPQVSFTGSNTTGVKGIVLVLFQEGGKVAQVSTFTSLLQEFNILSWADRS